MKPHPVVCHCQGPLDACCSPVHDVTGKPWQVEVVELTNTSPSRGIRRTGSAPAGAHYVVTYYGALRGRVQSVEAVQAIIGKDWPARVRVRGWVAP